jgi:2-keto-4-pentenoate hydratase
MDLSHVQQAAQFLWDCRVAKRPVAALPPELTPRSLADAYSIQEKLVTLLSENVAGWKVGLTTPQAQAANHTDRPISGRLLEDRVYRSPTVLAGDGFFLRVVEAELAFVFHKSFNSEDGPFTRDQIISGIDCVRPAIEICESRFIDCDILELPSIVADNSNHGALVLGNAITSFQDIDASNLVVTLSSNNHDSIVGNTNSVLGDPVNSLLWLINDEAGPPRVIEAGQIVASGACAAITLARGPVRILADFGALGNVVVDFTHRGIPLDSKPQREDSRLGS